MAKVKTKRSVSSKPKNVLAEPDSAFFLKIVLYLILGSLWLRISNDSLAELPLPTGLLIGILFASHEQFQVDRKIEYALLLTAAFIGFWLPMGINIVL